MNIMLLSAAAFVLSFVFALGGVGSAIALVPFMIWTGIPVNAAKPTGLFVNTVSMIGASYSNFKNRRLNVKLGLPIIISSVITAPLGAYLTGYIHKSYVMIIFMLFLIFLAVYSSFSGHALSVKPG